MDFIEPWTSEASNIMCIKNNNKKIWKCEITSSSFSLSFFSQAHLQIKRKSWLLATGLWVQKESSLSTNWTAVDSTSSSFPCYMLRNTSADLIQDPLRVSRRPFSQLSLLTSTKNPQLWRKGLEDLSVLKWCSRVCMWKRWQSFPQMCVNIKTCCNHM